jgi:hypothetical protein
MQQMSQEGFLFTGDEVIPLVGELRNGQHRLLGLTEDCDGTPQPDPKDD